MTLSPHATPFFSCTSQTLLAQREKFLYLAKELLSDFDYSLLSEILLEWESCPLLSTCFSKWKHSIPSNSSFENSLYILSFNVRGLELRIQEVLLLSLSFNFDILVLLETGVIDFSFCSQAFSNFNMYYQRGEISNGGVLIFVRNTLKSIRVCCSLPNVCVVDIFSDEEKVRLLGIYAPESRSWKWENISQYLAPKCVIYGDFNVDLKKDKMKAELLLEWADAHFLAPFVPDVPTSLRSDRTIDFALCCGFLIDIQAYEGNTTSDHKPILSIIPCSKSRNILGRNVHWKVFSFFCEYVYNYWEARWVQKNFNEVYNDYVTFLSLLITRCTKFFPLKKYRIAIPQELRAFLSYIRAITFRQIKTRDIFLKETVHNLRKIAKKEIKQFISTQVSLTLNMRHTSSPFSVAFWSKTKRFFKPSSCALQGFILPDGNVTKDPINMSLMAADYYEKVFEVPENIMRPHPYTDAPWPYWDNYEEKIPAVFLEVLEIVQSLKKKKSCDAHGLCNFMFNFLPIPYWCLLLKTFNWSFEEAYMPAAWKEVRILLLAKKDSICAPSLTRPISLLDIFLKIDEKLFLTRFRDVLDRRGLIPDTQSGFREKFRLQTRVLLFIEQVQSMMANSSPVATVFVDFKSAFDQLWFEGCLGKLRRLGIPKSYLNWIATWLANRRAFVEIKGEKSRWFPICRGGPQGSIFTPTLFITYHSDLAGYLNICSSFMFADDLAAVIAGSIGNKYSSQCLDLERKLRIFFDNLESYAILSVQPVNLSKTVALWSARAIGPPKFDISLSGNKIIWVNEFKYLGYWITPKLGWSTMIRESLIKIRQRVSMINSFRIYGHSSTSLRKILFLSYVLPLFTWLFILIPLFTQNQRNDLSHFYFTMLKRVSHCLHLSDSLFAFILEELSLEDRCIKYWDRYLFALSDSIDGELLLEQMNLNQIRKAWLKKEFPIRGIHRSKRYVEHTSVLEKGLQWCSATRSSYSTIEYDISDIITLEEFAETF